MNESLGIWGVPLAMLGGMIRVSTPYLFVSLGETLTEKSGRINLGLEGTLLLGAVSAYGVSYLTGSPWLGVLAAGSCGVFLGAVHAVLCSRPRVNDVAVGIAMMLFGMGLSFYVGKPLIQPEAPQLPALELGAFSANSAVRDALRVNPLFLLGIALAFVLRFGLQNTRWGLTLRTVGESADTARALGYSVDRVRLLATMAGGFLSGIGGSFLSLYYPGVWNEGLSSGQGLIAVALVIFARWNPIYCLYASLIYGAAGSLGPALQAIGVEVSAHLLGALPAALTLAIMIATSSAERKLAGAPAELGVSN
ncbi:MAG TPA: ABC transporter permease [Polyangiales bacterium]|nr:ABC transporter permease [Polyangiales bacterium]